MKLLEKLLNTVAPNQCLVCDQEGSLLCEWCLPDVFEAVPSRCAFCIRKTDHSAVCAKCVRQTPLRQVWVSTIYKDVAKKLVQHMKFHPDRSACLTIARWLDETMPYFSDVTISFVPSARTRVRQRGFDHAALIAQEFAALRQLPCEKLLERQGSLRQVGSEKKQRIQQVLGAYRAVGTPPASVILIDDIMTTGATLSEAARTLKKAGARNVNALIFAQTI